MPLSKACDFYKLHYFLKDFKPPNRDDVIEFTISVFLTPKICHTKFHENGNFLTGNKLTIFFKKPPKNNNKKTDDHSL